MFWIVPIVLLSSSVGKVRTGTYNFVSVILNVAFVGEFIAGIAVSALWSVASVIIWKIYYN